MKKTLIGLFSVLVASLVASTAIYAASLSVRLSEPKSPTNQSSFDINFVTLDTTNSPSPITVKCFKKGPSDAAFTQFGSEITISAGGNTSNCPVSSAVLNADGTYQFQATATNGSETQSSNIVTVDFGSSSGPGTPTNYSREQPSSCVWRIKFKSADDGGKTVNVEVYRSENTSFNADSGTRVATVSIGSNTDGSADVTSPDCSKTYYFAVRAFDSFGNGSGVVGDSVTTVTTTSSTTTTTSTAPSPSPAGTGAIPVSGEGGASVLGSKTNVGAGEVLAASTASATPKASTVPSPASKPTSGGMFSAKTMLISGGALLILAIGSFLLLRRSRKAR